MDVLKVQKQGRNENTENYPTTENCGKERVQDYSTTVADYCISSITSRPRLDRALE